MSDDGGGEITFDNGSSWSSIDIMPTAQFYRVNVDNLFPYNLYGGQQDNSTVRIASIGSGGGISERDWSSTAGGESAFLAFDPDNPQLVMGGSYLGSVNIYDTKAKARKIKKRTQCQEKTTKQKPAKSKGQSRKSEHKQSNSKQKASKSKHITSK